MKKYIAILGLGILGLTFSSCEKEPSFNYPDGTVGSSKVTVYPVLALKGGARVLLTKGTAYTEAGLTAFEGTTALTPVTTGSVDVSKAGVYTITYSATNKDGFSASVTRKVVVYDTQASAAANDFSGTYARNTNGLLAVWTKIAPGVYSVVNPGGADSGLTVIVFNASGSSISIPQQLASDGTLTSSSEESYDAATGRYSWKIINAGYGDASRTFVKQ